VRKFVQVLLLILLMLLPATSRAQDGVGYSPAQLAQEWKVHEAEQVIELSRQQNVAYTEAALSHHKVAAYWLQFYTSILLTIVAVAFVVASIWFAYLQYRIDREKGPGAASTLKISATGVEVSSSVVGLFVLIAAMVFFYVYVNNVYAIQVITSVQQPSTAAAPPLAK